VIVAIGTDDVVHIHLLAERILAMLWLSGFAVTTDVVHSIGMIEGEEVGSYTNNGTIPEVKVQDLAVTNAVEKNARIGDARNGCEFGTREFAEGVEENIVYATPYEVAQALGY
jgi:hypothetical protein